MPIELINLLTQAPIIALFAWYVLETNKRSTEAMNKHDEDYRQSQAKRDEAYLKTLTELTSCIKEISEKQDQHYADSRVSNAILMDRIGRPKATKSPPAKE